MDYKQFSTNMGQLKTNKEVNLTMLNHHFIWLDTSVPHIINPNYVQSCKVLVIIEIITIFFYSKISTY